MITGTSTGTCFNNRKLFERSGFAACGIVPICPDRVLAKLPPEEDIRRDIRTDLDNQVLEELKRMRYGDPGQKKATRAKKVDRLPAGQSYTVSAIPVPVPPGSEAGAEGQGNSGDQGRRRKRPQQRAFLNEQDLIAIDNMGADSESEDETDMSNDDEDEDEDDPPHDVACIGDENEVNMYCEARFACSGEGDQPGGERSNEPRGERSNEPRGERSNEPRGERSNEPRGERSKEPRGERSKKPREEQIFSVGEFVTAVYGDEWLVARVDTDQSCAGPDHVNLSYMEKVPGSSSHFKWPNKPDLLLTLKEDILTRCSAPTPVGSSTRASYVSLSSEERAAADLALDEVVYLKLSIPSFFLCFFINYGTGTILW